MSNVSGWIITAGASTAVLAAWWRWLRPRWVSFKYTAKEFRDAILGRPPVLHPDTGKQLAPAVPGIGARQANMEGQLVVLTQAVASLANQGQRLDDHERRLGVLEEAAHERTIARTETVELLRTIETAMKTPPLKPEA
jgi:hypothetical protein